MITVKIAGIFESEGKEIVGLLLIHGTSSDGHTTFGNPRERAQVAEWTYKAYAQRIGLPSLTEMSSEEEGLLNKKDDREIGSGCEDDDEDKVDVIDHLPRMRKHIHNSFETTGRVGEGDH